MGRWVIVSDLEIAISELCELVSDVIASPSSYPFSGWVSQYELCELVKLGSSRPSARQGPNKVGLGPE